LYLSALFSVNEHRRLKPLQIHYTEVQHCHEPIGK